MREQSARLMVGIETKDAITEVLSSEHFWFKDGEKHHWRGLNVHVRGSYVSFDFDDSRLPDDIEDNYGAYHLCRRRFECGKIMSQTGLTSVWFESKEK